MATCPLCSGRAGKRFCPAKAEHICGACCGTKREIELDCPGSCPYLQSSRDYESEKRVLDAELMAKVQKFDEEFVDRYAPVLDVISAAVVEERVHAPWLVDNDVVEVFKTLSATMKTLSSGIYYESLPDGAARISLYRRLKNTLDEMMQPAPSPGQRTLKVSESLDVLDFLTFAAMTNSSMRPKSRRYLDFLSRMAGHTTGAEQSSGLILP